MGCGLPHDDAVEFTASVTPAGRSVSCAPIDRKHEGPRLYGCQASLQETSDTHEPSFTFRIFRIGGR